MPRPNASAAAVQRAKSSLAVVVVAALLGSSVAWAVALWVAPLGAYEVALHMDDGRFAIVLDRRAPSDRAPRQADPAMNDRDGLHDVYVVTLATLDACSRADSENPTKVGGPSLLATWTLGAAGLATTAPGRPRARTASSSPVSFSILRI